MYSIGDRVVYGIHGICSVAAIEQRTVDRKQVEYYALEPLEQPGARYYIPTQNQAALAKLRPLLTKQEMEALLASEEAHRDCWIAEEAQRKQRYRELIGGGDRAALLSMVRCLYRHREACLSQGRKFHLCDDNFLRDAQKILVSEISQVLELDPDQAGAYLREM